MTLVSARVVMVPDYFSLHREEGKWPAPQQCQEIPEHCSQAASAILSMPVHNADKLGQGWVQIGANGWWYGEGSKEMQCCHL